MLLSAAINEWATRNDTSRSDAFRRLVELGLTVGGKQQHTTAATADRAKELASKAIDSLTAGAPNNDEKASRKRRLIKGPEEFQEARVDRPAGEGKGLIAPCPIQSLATIFRGDRAGFGAINTSRGSQHPVRRLNPAWGLVRSKDEEDRQRNHHPGYEDANPVQHRDIVM
jgi:hypothetical protein